MKKVTFTEAQILGILKEQEQGLKVSEICRKVMPRFITGRISTHA